MYIFFVYFQSSFFIFILFIIYKILIAPVFRTKYPFRKAEKGQEKKVSWNDGHATVSQYWKLLVTLPLELPVACALAGFFFFFSALVCELLKLSGHSCFVFSTWKCVLFFSKLYCSSQIHSTYSIRILISLLLRTLTQSYSPQFCYIFFL